ncbi:uncharacterized protein (TIGR02284 family) [Flavobacterium sp. CG_23.5]|uniref:ferritin-like domain-containing protein n=1 Tax=unclassified Flavobacterium TaxID=196869 RepID=UPI001A234A27|nr:MULTISPECIES: PA2169 family four-helix-bundle protein [unclassified Flavobacterium]MBG6111152.1 uncharacterized protein (TIGR02284 family) [Flavobacterium sp. CG_9.10]MBP2284356.1 uncharacterized protein (TIGR02284 family) [Flavobacterium sp. CG_23.5]
MENEKTISLLNNLIEINNDRIEGYKTATDETDESDLKALFTQFKQTSEKCKSELTSEVHRLGAEPVEGTRVTGKFFRVWMDVKAALTGKDRKAILNSCEYGEGVAQDNYEDTLKDASTDLSFEQQNMLKSQLEVLRADHNTVKQLSGAIA